MAKYDIVLKSHPLGETYARIVKANKKAREMGISYGQYIAMTEARYKRVNLPKTEKNKQRIADHEEAQRIMAEMKQRLLDSRETKPIEGLSGSELEKYHALTDWDSSTKPLREYFETGEHEDVPLAKPRKRR